jgi:hypothetical protein
MRMFSHRNDKDFFGYNIKRWRKATISCLMRAIGTGMILLNSRLKVFFPGKTCTMLILYLISELFALINYHVCFRPRQ